MKKIHYLTMILYLNYKNNIYKVENENERDGKDWVGKKVTILYQNVLIVKSSGIIQFCYLHFT